MKKGVITAVPMANVTPMKLNQMHFGPFSQIGRISPPGDKCGEDPEIALVQAQARERAQVASRDHPNHT